MSEQKLSSEERAYKIMEQCSLQRPAQSLIRLEKELVAAFRREEELVSVIRKGMEMQRPGDIWSVQPNKIRAFMEAAEAALSTASGKEQG